MANIRNIPTESNTTFAVLSEREKEISEMLAWGYSDKEISAALFISLNTVRTHHRNIYIKTGCRNLADITRYYFSHYKNTQLPVRPSFNRVMGVFICLFLIIYAEFFNNTNFIRVKRAARIARVRKTKSKKRNLLIANIS